MDPDLHKDVIAANIALHTSMASEYDSCEPHFRPENQAHVDSILQRITAATSARRLLDLGCGTGFVINLAKKYVGEIDGVDVTPAMLARVDKSGPARITVHEHDAATFPAEADSYDVATGYSFIHHLFDSEPILRNAYRALRSGGMLYIDLEPNYYFWETVNALDGTSGYDIIVEREVQAVAHRDEEIEAQFGVAAGVFNRAEYSKSVKGGFKEEDLIATLHGIGFREVDFFYRWYIGQGVLINEEGSPLEDRIRDAAAIDRLLQRALPISRSLYKYVGFIATK